jgi:hypothetical protein
MKVMPLASIKPKIIGLTPGGRIQFFLQGTYSALVGETSRPVINPFFTELEAVLLRRFLAVRDRPLDAFDLYNRAEASWA